MMIIGNFITEELIFGNRLSMNKIMMILEIITESQIWSHVKYTIVAESIRS